MSFGLHYRISVLLAPKSALDWVRSRVHGYLDHKKTPLPRTLLGLCIGPYMYSHGGGASWVGDVAHPGYEPTKKTSLHGGGASWVGTVARFGFVPAKSSHSEFRSRSSSHVFLRRNSTTSRPSRLRQLSGYCRFCFRNEGKARMLFGSAENRLSPLPMSGEEVLAMSGEEYFESCCVALKTPRRRRRRLPFVCNSLMWLAFPSIQAPRPEPFSTS